MVDMQKIKLEFNKYVSNFDKNDGKIKLKIEHILRVTELSKKIAVSLNLDEENIELAEIIGLFHDIGRFEQIKKYNTFSDRESENHAKLGVKVLFEQNLIENFNIDKKYYSIIKTAILNHNKDAIDNNLTDIETLHSKIIRDADKLDILYNISNYDFKDVFWYNDFNCKKINELLIKDLENRKHVNYNIVKNNADLIPTFFAFMYDLNFKFSIKYLKEKNYLQIFAEKVNENFESRELKEQMQKIMSWYNNFLENVEL